VSTATANELSVGDKGRPVQRVPAWGNGRYDENDEMHFARFALMRVARVTTLRREHINASCLFLWEPIGV